VEHVWWNEDGDVVARLDDENHALMAPMFELRDDGIIENEHHWLVLAEINFDPEDEMNGYND